MNGPGREVGSENGPIQAKLQSYARREMAGLGPNEGFWAQGGVEDVAGGSGRCQIGRGIPEVARRGDPQ